MAANPPTIAATMIGVDICSFACFFEVLRLAGFLLAGVARFLGLVVDFLAIFY